MFFLLSFLEALPLMGLAFRLSRAAASCCCGGWLWLRLWMRRSGLSTAEQAAFEALKR